MSLIESGTVATVIAARDDRLNRNIEEQRHLFLLCRSQGTTIDLLEDGVWASVDLGDLFNVALEAAFLQQFQEPCALEGPFPDHAAAPNQIGIHR